MNFRFVRKHQTRDKYLSTLILNVALNFMHNIMSNDRIINKHSITKNVEESGSPETSWGTEENQESVSTTDLLADI